MQKIPLLKEDMVTSLVRMHWRVVYERVLPHLSLEIYVQHIYVVFLKHMSDKRQELSAVRVRIRVRCV